MSTSHTRHPWTSSPVTMGCLFDLADAGSNGAKPSFEVFLEPCLTIEILSESEMPAIYTCKPGSNFGGNPVLTFDVMEG